MKFSVLLPTRNRLEYLRYAVQTVLRQDHDDWEIIVSDNHSEEDIAGYVGSLNEPRIKYFRTASFVPVTENWNNALRESQGDYVVMLGDDDGLLPHYFSRLEQAFQSFRDPDFVYVSAYFFAYPGVMPEAPEGFLRRDRNGLSADADDDSPFWLDHERAADVARGYLNFRMPVASNMQFSLISRRKIVELANGGEFFRSPFPDFFATPRLFLKSQRILIYPVPMVVIGISPKSYGFFHFNQKPEEGVKFLKNDQANEGGGAIRSVMLPGTPYNDSWLLANEELSAAHGDHYVPNYRRYRFLQILHCYKRRYFDGTLPVEQLTLLRAKMRPIERLVYGFPLPVALLLLKAVPIGPRKKAVATLRRWMGQHAIRDEHVEAGTLRNLIDVFEVMKSRAFNASLHARPANKSIGTSA